MGFSTRFTKLLREQEVLTCTFVRVMHFCTYVNTPWIATLFRNEPCALPRGTWGLGGGGALDSCRVLTFTSRKTKIYLFISLFIQINKLCNIQTLCLLVGIQRWIKPIICVQQFTVWLFIYTKVADLFEPTLPHLYHRNIYLTDTGLGSEIQWAHM